MRLQLEKQLLFLSLLCILSKVCAQLCRRPCYCPWVPPRCPRGSPLVLDGCGCCKICARRLGEPCDFLHVCDQSQGLVCDYSTAATGTGAICNFEDDEEGCEVNGRVYREGEVFQPSCKLQCRCLDGGFTCVPLCQEDVRLPTPDCPYPRRVEIPGKCCPEWICETQDRHLLRDAGAAPRAASPVLPYPCQEWGTEWSACSATCGVGFSTRVSNQNRYCRLSALHGQTLPSSASSIPGEGKRRSSVAVPTLVTSRSQRLILAKSLAPAHGTVVSAEMKDEPLGKPGKN
ncbi:PREDICTED: WNT1-inducible-signaling pathway protein 2 [Pterocles gutturalis]|uniref:WNT1-inducible-signaling pathway protein 2 n=1 Tax=Pterocles gutturalis TaxID=240206 RepID=UPI000528C38C|nr:PREDICTED: WNT1-inducible-signaling pathway protein 2 [Pterocles gutturalis]